MYEIVPHSYNSSTNDMVEFLLTFSRCPLRKQEHKFWSDRNRTHDCRTNRCADYLPNHSGYESFIVIVLVLVVIVLMIVMVVIIVVVLIVLIVVILVIVAIV